MGQYCWFYNTKERELRELNFNVADWYICLTIMDEWYYLFLSPSNKKK